MYKTIKMIIGGITAVAIMVLAVYVLWLIVWMFWIELLSAIVFAFLCSVAWYLVRCAGFFIETVLNRYFDK